MPRKTNVNALKNTIKISLGEKKQGRRPRRRRAVRRMEAPLSTPQRPPVVVYQQTPFREAPTPQAQILRGPNLDEVRRELQGEAGKAAREQEKKIRAELAERDRQITELEDIIQQSGQLLIKSLKNQPLAALTLKGDVSTLDQSLKQSAKKAPRQSDAGLAATARRPPPLNFGENPALSGSAGGGGGAADFYTTPPRRKQDVPSTPPDLTETRMNQIRQAYLRDIEQYVKTGNLDGLKAFSDSLGFDARASKFIDPLANRLKAEDSKVFDAYVARQLAQMDPGGKLEPEQYVAFS